MPHQLHNTAFVYPFRYGGDITIVDPAVTIGHADMDEIVTVHGWPFACNLLLDLIGERMVPVHIGHHT